MLKLLELVLIVLEVLLCDIVGFSTLITYCEKEAIYLHLGTVVVLWSWFAMLSLLIWDELPSSGEEILQLLDAWLFCIEHGLGRMFIRLCTSVSRWIRSYASSSSYSWMIVSSRSFSLVVRAIMISRCLSRSCLYRSTYTLSSSSCCRSFSSAYIFLSYCSRIRRCCSSTAVRNCTVFSIEWPPINICEWIYRIFSSSFFFSSRSTKNCLLLASRAAMAAFLSCSARRLSSSNYMTRVLSTNPLLFSWSSARSRCSSTSYFRRRAF